MDVFTLNILLMLFHAFGYKFLYPKKTRRRIFITIATIQNCFIMGLRDVYSVGVDLVRYSNTYYTIKGSSIDEIFYNSGKKYALWRLTNYVFTHLDFDYQFFVCLIAIFSVSTMGWFIYKYSQNVVLGYFLYMGLGVYTFQYSGLKQTIAMTFILLCYDADRRKRYITAGFLLVVAVLFHPTAVVFLAYLLGKRIKINALSIAAVLLCGSIIFINRLELAQIIVSIFADEYIGYYSVSEKLGTTAIFLIGILILYLAANYRRIKIFGSLENNGIYLLVIAIGIQIFSSFSYTFSRLNLFYLQFAPIFVPAALNGYNLKVLKKFYRPAIWGMWLLLMLIAINQYYSHLGSESLMPYSFFWNSVI